MASLCDLPNVNGSWHWEFCMEICLMLSPPRQKSQPVRAASMSPHLVKRHSEVSQPVPGDGRGRTARSKRSPRTAAASLFARANRVDTAPPSLRLCTEVGDCLPTMPASSARSASGSHGIPLVAGGPSGSAMHHGGAGAFGPSGHFHRPESLGTTRAGTGSRRQ